jgi:hypothetical protein
VCVCVCVCVHQVRKQSINLRDVNDLAEDHP